MKKAILLFITTFFFVIGCSNVEAELNSNVYEAFKNLIHLEPKEACESNCDEWDDFGNKINILERAGNIALNTTGFASSATAQGRSYVQIFLNEEDKQARFWFNSGSYRSRELAMRTGNGYIAQGRWSENIFNIDFSNRPFLFEHDDRYGAGFQGYREDTGMFAGNNYSINVTYFLEDNSIQFSTFGSDDDDDWHLGGRFYFKDKAMTKQAMDNFVTSVKNLREYQRSGFFEKIFYSR